MNQSKIVSAMKLSGKYLFSARPGKLALALGVILLGTFTVTVHAGNIYVPNFSFESPGGLTSFPYATNEVDEWAETPQPADYNAASNNNTPWSYLVGTFYNVPFPGSYINNMDGTEAALLSAYPGVGLLQDYNTIGGTNSAPDHAFNAVFEVGEAYTLTVGLTSSSDVPLTPGSVIQLSLYYRDSASNIVTVAETNVTYNTNVFADLTELVDFSVQVPGVKATDPWAGQNIGMEILCVPTIPLEGGYWDADNVRLTKQVFVPNYSFESPGGLTAFPFATNEVDEWEETPQPSDYNAASNNNTPWSYLAGTFYNVPFPGSYISNIDGVQAALLSAYPGVGLLEDYNTIGGTNTAPDHALNATFEPGKAYTLTVGLTSSSDVPLTPGSTIQLSMYYRDSGSNIVTVAATTVTFDTNVFTNLTQLTDFQTQVRGVKPTDPWAGQNIGIELLCTPSLALEGGYWDADNVRLIDTVALNLVNPTLTNGLPQFTIASEPGVPCQILATTNLSVPVANWTSLGTVSNVTGNSFFVDKKATPEQRFYTARQLGVSKKGP
jgi:hypothetical protein